MRQVRTEDEKLTITKLMSLLEKEEENWKEDPSIQDAPDLVLEHKDSGKRVACEITTVGLNEWHQWANDPNFQLDANKLDEIVCPREPDYWLKMVFQSKNPKVSNYLANANASEAWLVVHGDMHDFFCLDDDYDIPVMQDVAINEKHNFERIFVASPNSKNCQIAQIYPSKIDLPIPDLKRRANVKAVQIRSMKINLSNGGRHGIKIGEEFTSDRQIVLPMLDKTRR